MTDPASLTISIAAALTSGGKILADLFKVDGLKADIAKLTAASEEQTAAIAQINGSLARLKQRTGSQPTIVSLEPLERDVRELRAAVESHGRARDALEERIERVDKDLRDHVAEVRPVLRDIERGLAGIKGQLDGLFPGGRR